ncbi:envelope stress response membrane protein PspC [Alteromonas pelagimontana]|uniref:Envelope stress response membrane protein PspC n=1 Tax=Alteromonas pelagimontana TaxID=1858656 RepID=A0A6M4MFQ2_9ALTE|nr:envelope stress response membrane protein PspC [Alteromonas pelagimontana]QJR81903.1 envelope stress response membrane protein PspC [Alteromonas pelagimontana]
MNHRKQLFRDTENARIAGVCSGVANYFGIERWLVRILFVTAFFLLAGAFMVVAYVAGWFILDKKPINLNEELVIDPFHEGKGWRNKTSDAGKGHKVEVKRNVWQAGEPPKQAFRDISDRFKDSELRLRNMEKYVTSREFQLNREISRL